MITDIHLRISPESGDLMAFDDDENEVTRCVIEEWIDYKNENFYDTLESKHRSFLFLQLVLMTFVKDVRDGFMLMLETGWSTGNLPF